MLELRELRDLLAHGKPQFTTREWESEGTHNELEAELKSFRPDWQTKVDPAFFLRAFEDVDTAWKMMLEAGNIRVYDTLDHGSRGMTFLSYAEQEQLRESS